MVNGVAFGLVAELLQVLLPMLLLTAVLAAVEDHLQPEESGNNLDDQLRAHGETLDRVLQLRDSRAVVVVLFNRLILLRISLLDDLVNCLVIDLGRHKVILKRVGTLVRLHLGLELALLLLVGRDLGFGGFHHFGRIDRGDGLARNILLELLGEGTIGHLLGGLLGVCTIILVRNLGDLLVRDSLFLGAVIGAQLP